MTWNAGTSTNYIDLLDQLIEVLTSRHLDAIVINAAGTGYVAGDILGITNTGSTNTHVAQIEVLTVGGGGNITLARIYRGGAYTVDPTTTTANPATGGTGASATFDLTFAETGWDLQRRTKEATSATVAAGGTGYGVGNVLTVVGGVIAQGGAAATFTVATLSGSAVATVTLTTPGKYEVPPANPCIVSGGAGTGATLNVTYADFSGDTLVVLTGDAGGSNPDPVVGIKTYQGFDETGLNPIFNWAVFMATAYSSLVALHDLPNISAGFNTATDDGQLTASTTGDGAFVPLKDADAFNIAWWIRASGRCFSLIARVQAAVTTYYAEFSVGLLNQYGITQELPYPAYIIAASDRPKVWYRDTNSLFGGLSDVISRNNGPAFAWGAEGAWIEIKNSLISSQTSLTPSYTGQENDAPRAQLWPMGDQQARSGNDQIWDTAGVNGFDNEDLTDATPTLIYRTPDTGGNLFPLFPEVMTQADSATGFFRAFGEVDGIYWFSLAGELISSEDRHTPAGTDRYTIFQSGTRIQPWSFFAIRED